VPRVWAGASMAPCTQLLDAQAANGSWVSRADGRGSSKISLAVMHPKRCTYTHTPFRPWARDSGPKAHTLPNCTPVARPRMNLWLHARKCAEVAKCGHDPCAGEGCASNLTLLLTLHELPPTPLMEKRARPTTPEKEPHKDRERLPGRLHRSLRHTQEPSSHVPATKPAHLYRVVGLRMTLKQPGPRGGTHAPAAALKTHGAGQDAWLALGMSMTGT
jgi:hypothetical protein